MIKLLSWTFQPCFGQFTKFLVERSSETGLFRHLSYNIFHSLQFPKYISHEDHLFFLNCAKFNLDFKTAKKKKKIRTSVLLLR